MTTPVEARGKLDRLATELGALASKLAEVEQELEPVNEQYTSFVDDFETGLWLRHESDGAKLPSEAMRLKLAHRSMDANLLGRHHGLLNKRLRLKQQISAKKAEIDAQRSILSALKVEMEASS